MWGGATPTPSGQAGTHQPTAVAPSSSFSLTHSATACSRKPIPTHKRQGTPVYGAQLLRYQCARPHKRAGPAGPEGAPVAAQDIPGARPHNADPPLHPTCDRRNALKPTPMHLRHKIRLTGKSVSTRHLHLAQLNPSQSTAPLCRCRCGQTGQPAAATRSPAVCRRQQQQQCVPGAVAWVSALAAASDSDAAVFAAARRLRQAAHECAATPRPADVRWRPALTPYLVWVSSQPHTCVPWIPPWIVHPYT